jgi:hypothetical protein
MELPSLNLIVAKTKNRNRLRQPEKKSAAFRRAFCQDLYNYFFTIFPFFKDESRTMRRVFRILVSGVGS